MKYAQDSLSWQVFRTTTPDGGTRSSHQRHYRLRTLLALYFDPGTLEIVITLIISGVGVFLFVAVGIVALTKTKSLQSYAIRSHEKYPAVIRMKSMQDYLQSPRYLLVMRIIGVVSIATGVTILLLVFGKN